MSTQDLLGFKNRIRSVGSTNRFQRKARLLAFSVLCLISGAAIAAPMYTTGPLAFSTIGQSMWGPGGAIRFQDEIFLGAEWTNLSGGIGAIILGTGLRADLTTSGKLGLKFGYTVDSGSVDADAEFSATAILPSMDPTRGQFFNLNPMSSLDNGSIGSQSPKAEAFINAIAELSGSVTGKACLTFVGCAQDTLPLPSVAVEQPILVIDPNSLKILPGLPPPLPDPLAEIAILNQEVTLEGTLTPTPNPPFVLPGFKVSTAAGTIIDTSPTGTPEFEVDLASIEAQLPDISTSGGLVGNLIKSSGRDDFLSAKIDIDGVATMAGLPPTGIGVTLVDIPGFKIGVQFDALDVDAGPDLGITQDFELDPTLMVRLDFSAPVTIGSMSGMHTFWQGAWDSLPSIALLETTTFNPTFWLDAMLTNSIGIDLGLSGTLDLFKFEGTATVAGIDLISIGPISLNSLLGLGNELFSTPKLRLPIFGNSFALGGFNMVAASPFTINVNVPEPGTLILLLFGLGSVASARRRSRDKISNSPVHWH